MNGGEIVRFQRNEAIAEILHAHIFDQGGPEILGFVGGAEQVAALAQDLRHILEPGLVGRQAPLGVDLRQYAVTDVEIDGLGRISNPIRAEDKTPVQPLG